MSAEAALPDITRLRTTTAAGKHGMNSRELLGLLDLLSNTIIISYDYCCCYNYYPLNS